VLYVIDFVAENRKSCNIQDIYLKPKKYFVHSLTLSVKFRICSCFNCWTDRRYFDQKLRFLQR